MTLAVALLVRYLVVALFFSFSALDKLLNFPDAVGKAQEVTRSHDVVAWSRPVASGTGAA